MKYRDMTMRRYKTFLVAAFFLLCNANPAVAGEIFHWVDADGVMHFSDWAPADNNVEVSKVFVSNSNPPDYDPDADQNSILGQAERTNERWSELREQKEERSKQRRELEELERRRYAVEYDYPYYSDSYLYYRPGYRPVHRPGIGRRPPFRVARRQFAALDHLGLTGPRPHSINSSAHLARINAGKSLSGNFQPHRPAKLNHAASYQEY
jgi:hypothetical protein